MFINKKSYIKSIIALSTVITFGAIALPTNFSTSNKQSVITSTHNASTSNTSTSNTLIQTNNQKKENLVTNQTTIKPYIEKQRTEESYPTVDLAATFSEHGRPVIYTNILKTNLAKKKAELEKAGAHVVVGEHNISLASTAETPDPLTNTEYDKHVRLTKNNTVFPISKGKGVVVAVIDTGITPVPDTGRIIGAVDLAGTGLGPDGVPNGSSDTTDTMNLTPTDGYLGHGSHVASLINELYGNGLKSYGGAPEADILNIKVFGRSEISGNRTTTPLIIQGIYYAVDHGANIINISISIYGTVGYEDMQLFNDAFAYAQKKNVIIVTAMGNSNADISNQPNKLSAPNLIFVSASNEGLGINQEQDPTKIVKAEYSNYGTPTDLTAPGYQGVIDISKNYASGSGMRLGAGTSYTAPQVAAVFALLKAKYPTWTIDQLKQRIFSTADDIGPAGKDIYFGYGRVNAARALGGLGQTSPPPTNVIAQTKAYDEVNDINSDGSVNVSWTPPVVNSETALPYTYTVTSSPGGGTCTTEKTTCTVTNLAPNTKYSFSVTGYNYAGTKGASIASNIVSTSIPPATPMNVVATAGNSSANLTWQAPSSNGSTLTKYKIKKIDTSNNTSYATYEVFPTNGVLPNSYTVNYLQNNKTYIFSVTAYNNAGHSPESVFSAPVTPHASTIVYTPSVPLNIQATSTGANKVRISWTPPASNGGDSIISYFVTTSLNDANCTVASTQTFCELTNLKSGQAYTFRVTARNNAGNSPTGISSYFTVPFPQITITPPTNIIAKASNASAVVSWTPPSPQLPGISYIVTSSPGGYTCSSTLTQCAVTGLSNGTSYVFTVKTLYQNNISPASSKSNTIVPVAPVVVQSVTGVKILKYISASEATLGWTGKTNNTLYALRLSVKNSTTQFGTWIYTKVPSAPLKDLVPGGNYNVQVRSFIGNSASPITTYSFKQATTTSTVRTPTVIFPAKSTVTVKWLSPLFDGGTPLNFYYTRISAPNSTTVYSPWAITGTPQYSYTGRIKGKTYYVQILARNAIGNSAIITYSFVQKT